MKISELPAYTDGSTGELIPIVSDGITKAISRQELIASRWAEKTGNYQSLNGDRLLISAPNDAWTLTLPHDPRDGEMICLRSLNLTAKPLTISSIKKIDEVSVGTHKLIQSYASVELIFASALDCWVTYPKNLVTPIYPINNGIVSHWSLNEASGTRLDSTGTNHLTPTGSGVSSANGKIGQALSLTPNNYLSVANNPTLQISSAQTGFTMACWFNLRSVASYKSIVSKGWPPEYVIRLENGGCLGFRTQGGDLISGVIPIVNTWYFVSAKIKLTGEATLKINGTLAKSGTVSISPSTKNLYIGQAGDNTEYIDGIVDEVAIWKRCLTEEEEAALYNNGLGLEF